MDEVSADVDDQRQPAPNEGRTGGVRPTVLFIDDMSALRQLAGELLPARGFEVVLASDGLEAVETFERMAGRIDVVVLDLTLPRQNGVLTCRAIRAVRLDTRVVLTSGYPLQQATRDFHPGELAGFLRKPYRSSDLVRAIEDALAGRGGLHFEA